MNVDDKKYGLRLISYDEEEDVKSEYVVLLADISHLYWEADANGIIVPRRVAAEDYSHDHVNFFFDNTPDMILSQHGFVQVHEKMFVPARNIVSIHAVKGGARLIWAISTRCSRGEIRKGFCESGGVNCFEVVNRRS